MTYDMTDRDQVRINVSASSKAALDGVAERIGASKTSVVSRLIEWLARQDEDTQLEVLGVRRPTASISDETAGALAREARDADRDAKRQRPQRRRRSAG